jgi:hypothetical protein
MKAKCRCGAFLTKERAATNSPCLRCEQAGQLSEAKANLASAQREIEATKGAYATDVQAVDATNAALKDSLAESQKIRFEAEDALRYQQTFSDSLQLEVKKWAAKARRNEEYVHGCVFIIAVLAVAFGLKMFGIWF